MIIGITGSSGAGKSIVSKIIKQKYDAYLIDADEIARELTECNKEYLNEIVENFGNSILKDNNKLDREELSKIIYSNKEKRELLNSITFKFIVAEIKKKIKENSTSKYIVVDAPLLFESGLNSICDFVIGVVASKDRKLNRLKKRDNISVEILEKRLGSQKDDEFFKQKCDFIIENDFDSIEELYKKVDTTFKLVTSDK